jgi:hypothetical protein
MSVMMINYTPPRTAYRARVCYRTNAASESGILMLAAEMPSTMLAANAWLWCVIMWLWWGAWAWRKRTHLWHEPTKPRTG